MDQIKCRSRDRLAGSPVGRQIGLSVGGFVAMYQRLTFVNMFFLFFSRFKLHTAVNIEEAKDEGKGDRYLFEAAIEDYDTKSIRRLSVYLFRPEGTNRMCYPKNFQWKKDVMVHFILTGDTLFISFFLSPFYCSFFNFNFTFSLVKNQGAWVQQYIESLSKIYVKTKDTRFNLIITDFESFDINLHETLKKSSIPNYQVRLLAL